MATMNISLSNDLKSEVDEAVQTRGYVSSSEYIRDLIRRDLEVQRFRALISDGLESPDAGSLDKEFFADLDAEIEQIARG